MVPDGFLDHEFRKTNWLEITDNVDNAKDGVRNAEYQCNRLDKKRRSIAHNRWEIKEKSRDYINKVKSLRSEVTDLRTSILHAKANLPKIRAEIYSKYLDKLIYDDASADFNAEELKREINSILRFMSEGTVKMDLLKQQADKIQDDVHRLDEKFDQLSSNLAVVERELKYSKRLRRKLSRSVDTKLLRRHIIIDAVSLGKSCIRLNLRVEHYIVSKQRLEIGYLSYFKQNGKWYRVREGKDDREQNYKRSRSLDELLEEYLNSNNILK